MRTSNKAAICLLLLWGTTALSLAQSENWQITFSSGDTLSHIGLLRVRDDSLEVVSRGTTMWIAIASVNEVRSVSNVDVWGTARDGAWYTGAVAGAAAAVAIAVSAHSNPIYSVDAGNTAAKALGAVAGGVLYGSAFGLIGGTVAGVVALVQNQDVVHDLSQMNLTQKKYTLQAILRGQ